MASRIVNHIYKFKRGTEEAVFKANPVLMAGEPVVVLCDDNIVRLKIGDGKTQYIDLPFINQENDESLKYLIDEIDKLKREIHNAGDTVFQISAEELESVKGDTISKKITAYILGKNPIEVLTEGNLAIIRKVLDADSNEYGYATYVYTGDTWAPTSGDYSVDNTSIDIVDGKLSLIGFSDANFQTIPYKGNTGVVEWKNIETLTPIKGVDDKDKVLSLEDKKLKTTLTLSFDTETNSINLLGKNKAVLGTVDASKFLVQGMLKDVYYDATNNSLTFVWNTADGIKTDTVELSDIIDPYKASDGIDITGTSISIKLDDTTEDFLSVSESGLKLSGIQNAINSVATETQLKINELSSAVNTNKEIADATDRKATANENSIFELQTSISNLQSTVETNITNLEKDISELKEIDVQDIVNKAIDNHNTDKTHLTDEDVEHHIDSRLSAYDTTEILDDKISTAINTLVSDSIDVIDDRVQSLEEDISSLKSIDIEELIDNALESYPTSEQVDNKIKEAVDSIHINIIDGGRITDVNTNS